MMASAIWFVLLTIVAFHLSAVSSGDVGINYGREGDNLPSPKQVIDFLTKNFSNKIGLIRIYDANIEILEALSGTNLVVTIGVPNEAINYVASSQDAADKWVQDHIITYVRKGVRFRYLCVGNEVIPGILADCVEPAIMNLHNSVRKAGYDFIFVTTAVAANVLGTSYPPSQGQFAPNVADVMSSITHSLYSMGSPLLINVYPYYALVEDPVHIPFEYALFTSRTPIRDGHLEYYNLFDAMVDAFVAAMVRVVQREDVKLVVSETGWPTDGRIGYAITDYARTYNNKLREHAIVSGRTPRKADINLEVYIFAMFNEDLKTPEEEKNFGTFYPNFTEKYPLWR